jgi:hypothetical protein
MKPNEDTSPLRERKFAKDADAQIRSSAVQGFFIGSSSSVDVSLGWTRHRVREKRYSRRIAAPAPRFVVEARISRGVTIG